MTTAQYYIIVNNTPAGPYDLVMLVRKIRNGSLLPGTLLQEAETDITKPAGEWHALSDFFAERKDEPAVGYIAKSGVARHTLAASLTNGWRFLQRHQISAIFSGVFVLAVITMTALVNIILPGPLHIPAYMVCFIFSHTLLSCYLFCILRLTRGQPVDLNYLLSRIRPFYKSLLLSSLLISFAAICGLALLTYTGEIWEIPLAGLLIFAIPGLYLLTIYAFTPLLIIDQELDFWEAMEMSRKKLRHAGLESTGVVFALFVINFIGGMCLLLPLVIIMPITLSPLTEMYDELFS